MTHRALVMVDDRTATLVEVGDTALHCGHRTRDGLMVLRAAWKYEYAYPLGETYLLALPAAVKRGVKNVPQKASEPAPQPSRAPARVRVPSLPPLDLTAAPTWRGPVLAAAIENLY